MTPEEFDKFIEEHYDSIAQHIQECMSEAFHDPDIINWNSYLKHELGIIPDDTLLDKLYSMWFVAAWGYEE